MEVPSEAALVELPMEAPLAVQSSALALVPQASKLPVRRLVQTLVQLLQQLQMQLALASPKLLVLVPHKNVARAQHP